MINFFKVICLGLVCFSEAGYADEVAVLWNSEVAMPTSADLERVDGASIHVIQPYAPEVDGFPWIHGVALAWHKGQLYASFGRNRGAENTAGEEAHGRVSADCGRTWGPISIIDEGADENLAVSHGVFLSYGGVLWAFQGAFYGTMERVHTRAYILNEETGSWMFRGIMLEDGFWPMQEPIALDGGGFVMAGLCVEKGYGGVDDPAAVALSTGDSLDLWDLVKIPKAPELNMWGESTVIVSPEKIVSIARWREPYALYSESVDGGRTWSMTQKSNMPMAASKPYAGTLSTGQRYLICTTTADAGNRRSPLTIAVTKPGGLTFEKVYTIREAVDVGPGESHPNGKLSYPYAIERRGLLYVGYSNDGGRGKNNNSAELAVLPVASLGVK